jgi:hypothetical protein
LFTVHTVHLVLLEFYFNLDKKSSLLLKFGLSLHVTNMSTNIPWKTKYFPMKNYIKCSVRYLHSNQILISKEEWKRIRLDRPSNNKICFLRKQKKRLETMYGFHSYCGKEKEMTSKLKYTKFLRKLGSIWMKKYKKMESRPVFFHTSMKKIVLDHFIVK